MQMIEYKESVQTLPYMMTLLPEAGISGMDK